MVRTKSRYLLCEVNVSERSHLLLLDDRAVSGAVREAVGRLHGDYGRALCSFRFGVKYLNAQTGIVFLRFSKSCYKLLWSALPFITTIETQWKSIPCFLNCLHVGGTIRTCQKFLIRYNAQQLRLMLPKCKNEAEKEKVRKAILGCTLIHNERDSDDALDDDEQE